MTENPKERGKMGEKVLDSGTRLRGSLKTGLEWGLWVKGCEGIIQGG